MKFFTVLVLVGLGAGAWYLGHLSLYFVLLGMGSLGVVIAWLVTYVIRVYNHLVSLSNGLKKNGADIQLLMKQRHDELPKLVACCERYMGHENTTLKQVMEARAGIAKASNSSEVAAAESNMHAAIGAVFATVENYPNLKADGQVNDIMQRVTSLEESIASQRGQFNASVTGYNTRINQFPDKLVAAKFGFGPATMLSFTESETADIKLF